MNYFEHTASHPPEPDQKPQFTSLPFSKVKIGWTFDFVSGKYTDSFFETCKKISARKYKSLSTGLAYQVGTTKVLVYNVNSETRS
jgi:hypothetical protein